MSILESIILGIIQGLTEFIPVSSSGHEVLAVHFFGAAHDHLFLEFINIGTVLALLIFFRKRIFGILHDIFVDRNLRLARNIIISAVPAGVVGFTFASVIETNSFFSNPWVVSVMMLLVGIVMILLEKFPRLSDKKDGEALTGKRALGVGLAQVVALIPGTSRSGSTIIAGRLMGLSPAAAAEYSFLLSIPIMLGVLVKLALKDSDRAYFFANLTPILVSNAFALVSGLLAVGFLMRYLAHHDLKVFGWYRVGLAVVVMGVLLLQ
jgi:undecaprenyl-diphosphatase